MLPAPLRMRSANDFRRTVRSGVRAGRPCVVVHACRTDPSTHPGVRVGFVVSKAVGTAIVRNRVKRRLRHLVKPLLDEVPAASHWVVRALPAAAVAGDRLPSELAQAWRRCRSQLEACLVGSDTGAS